MNSRRCVGGAWRRRALPSAEGHDPDPSDCNSDRVLLKALLNNTALLWQEKLGWLGELRISRALIVELQQVLGTSAAAGYKTLYVPALIPFLLVVLLCIPLFRLNGGRAANVQRNRRAHCAALYCAVRRAGDGQPDDAGRRQRAGDPDR